MITTRLTIADHFDELDLEIFKKANIELSFLTISDISEKYKSL